MISSLLVDLDPSWPMMMLMLMLILVMMLMQMLFMMLMLMLLRLCTCKERRRHVNTSDISDKISGTSGFSEHKFDASKI